MPEAQTLGTPVFHDVHRGRRRCTPTFRVWRAGRFRYAQCQECEDRGRPELGSFVDRVENGFAMLRLNMHEHAAVFHTHT